MSTHTIVDVVKLVRLIRLCVNFTEYDNDTDYGVFSYMHK